MPEGPKMEATGRYYGDAPCPLVLYCLRSRARWWVKWLYGTALHGKTYVTELYTERLLQ